MYESQFTHNKNPRAKIVPWNVSALEKKHFSFFFLLIKCNGFQTLFFKKDWKLCGGFEN